MITQSGPTMCIAMRSLCAFLILFSSLPEAHGQTATPRGAVHVNDEGYFEGPGLNVMVFDDFYPEGHQGGITIVQCGTRVAANGDLRLEPTPGQWSPVPKIGARHIDRENGIITVDLWYPDSSKDRQGFNPILYPDLQFAYSIRAVAEGNSIRLIVDLKQPLPAAWAEKVGFNLELFPGHYFGEHYLMDGKTGIFPRQLNGPMMTDEDGNIQITPLAVGKKITIAPENEAKEITVVSNTTDLQLIDGRGLQNNGWFVLRSTIPAGTDRNAVEWVITPGLAKDWRYTPVIQVSQIGYHPKQRKYAVIELDKSVATYEPIQLMRIGEHSVKTVLSDPAPAPWGKFLRYTYVRFDFSSIAEEGLYEIRYGTIRSHQFEIKKDIYARHVWQPTLEYFLPVQMCHMRIKDRYKVWHGLCHMDDALMAPLNHNHFDGYYQHESTLTSFAPGEHVPGLNIGGWHDAGDYDLRVESQAETVYKLALAYEFFHCDHDETTIDQNAQVVTIHKPDGVPDILQQVEHGVLSIVGGFEAMDRLYRGIICARLEQYVHLGDGSTMTDNLIYRENARDPILGRPLPQDDRWVFTERNPQRELFVAKALAAATRVLRQPKPELAKKCLRISETLYQRNSSAQGTESINAVAELFLTTSKTEYATLLLANADSIGDNILRCSEVSGRVAEKLHDPQFTQKIESAAKKTLSQVVKQQQENPYGVPYRPRIWGAGWGIQSFGVKQLFLHLGFPSLFSSENAFNALNFVLGCHPGENNASFASGVGVQSLTVAYGANRDEWSYIPGGVGSGTALIRPDLPELKVWPYLWQQTEYVMGGGATDFMILAMAADRLLNR
jgi:hypothetical protein